MCCVCAWEMSKDTAASEYVKPDECDNKDFGVFTDLYGSGCEFYEKYPRFCGAYDDEDFAAKEMCCVCDPVFGSKLARESNYDSADIDPFTELQNKWLAEKGASGELRDGPIDYSTLDRLNEEGWNDLIND